MSGGIPKGNLNMHCAPMKRTPPPPAMPQGTVAQGAISASSTGQKLVQNVKVKNMKNVKKMKTTPAEAPANANPPGQKKKVVVKIGGFRLVRNTKR